MRLYFVIVLILSSLITGCTLSINQDDTTEKVLATSVQIVAPKANAAYKPGVMVNIQVLITHGDVMRADFLVDNNVIATQKTPDNQSTFSLTQSWQAVGIGSHVISLILYRADGTNLEPVSVPIMVLDVQPTEKTDMGIIATLVPTDTPQPTAQEQSTESPATPTDEPTAASAEVPSGTVIATFNNGVNVRSGPSRETGIVGTFAANQTAEVVAINSDGTWIKLQMPGGFGWVLTAYADIAGDINTLPLDG